MSTKLKENQIYVVKRYDGADPAIALSYPLLDLEGKLEAWEGIYRMLTFPAYEDDEVYELDLNKLKRIS